MPMLHIQPQTMEALMVDDDGTLIGEIASVIEGDAPAWATLPLELVAGALPVLMGLLAGNETAEEIAAPYLRTLFGLGLTALEDVIAKKPAATVRKAFDDAVGNLLEDVRFGQQAGSPL